MQKSFIDTKPAYVRKLIDQQIEAEGYRNFDALAKRFRRFGKGFSKSAIHRYAQRLEAFKARAKFEAEVMQNFSDEQAFLLRWAAAEPKAAKRLVGRLQAQMSVRVPAGKSDVKSDARPLDESTT